MTLNHLENTQNVKLCRNLNKPLFSHRSDCFFCVLLNIGWVGFFVVIFYSFLNSFTSLFKYFSTAVLNDSFTNGQDWFSIGLVSLTTTRVVYNFSIFQDVFTGDAGHDAVKYRQILPSQWTGDVHLTVTRYRSHSWKGMNGRFSSEYLY